MSSDEDVAEFAALLTELKARTERSYGSLARRLGMNTSTLHRYCAGEAVPQDFAPVERLAEFCGASPEERLELHRRWLRAVAARQARARGAEAEAEAGAGAGAGAGGEETAAAEATASPEAPAEVESVPQGVAQGVPQGVAQDAGSASVATPWYRRRRGSVLLGVACALLATVGTLSALPADRPSNHPSAAGTGAAPGRGPAATATAGTGGPASSSPTSGASPSASGSAGTSPDPQGSSGTTPSATPAPSSGAGSGAGSGSGVPLTWTADSQVWALGCGHDYVVDRPPSRVPPPPAAQDAGTWAAAQGAVHGRETNVQITVQGRSSTAVVLTALRVRVVGRATPLTGTAYAMDQGCGGSITPRSFAVDLDKDRPVARSVPGSNEGTPIPAVRMPYRVSAEDPEVLLVTARTKTCACDWYLELDWSSQGRTGTVRIDDRGRPFRTSGIEGLSRYMYDTGERRWRPYV
ncbi:helix-turn-helix transcriptional regulator [Streptomyces sp. CAI-85]|uniref:helix-turn-helix domain-containing protein n=1 Tax=Streptomyces sp. CAI-85 TaxID=1472662 RepID=UPI0015872EC1|nr:helix-turn-helix transcriptional regulator [Streptomyces sp. CAI-85]NUV59662.1 helix-turn-helix domain-containing protein [Streptomyces sp. CAI-85]